MIPVRYIDSNISNIQNTTRTYKICLLLHKSASDNLRIFIFICNYNAIPFDILCADLEYVLSVVEKNGKIILLKNNKPAYVLLKCDIKTIEGDVTSNDQTYRTLQEAMKVVLSEVKNRTMHASILADIIYERRLYLQKNGNKAKYAQIRSRCGHYPNMFEALPGNYIKLKG